MTCLGLSNYHLGLSMRYSHGGFAQPDMAWGRKSHTIVNSGKGIIGSMPDMAWGRKSHTIVNSGKGIIGSMGSKLGKKDEITVFFFGEPSCREE